MSAKAWNVNEAILYYGQQEIESEVTFEQLLLEIKSDLKNIGRTQKSLNRYVLKVLVEVDVSMSRKKVKKIINLCSAPI
jgi:hypothetical protein